MASVTAIQTALSNLEDRELAERAQTFLGAPPKMLYRTFLALPSCDCKPLFQSAPNLVGALTESDFIDLGTFRALYRMSPKDARGNAVSGNAIVEPDCGDNLIINQIDRPLVVVGVQGCVIVQTLDGSLCAPFAEADRIGNIYKQKIPH